MKLIRLLSAALVAAATLSVAALPARAQDQQQLIIGNVPLFMFRNGDVLNGREWSVQDRIDHIQEVLPKHLGGSFRRFTTRAWGDRVHIYLNGDFLVAVTPADARATGYKSAAQLAPVWVRHLQRGFAASHAGIERR